MPPQFTAIENQCRHCKEWFTSNCHCNYCSKDCERQAEVAEINKRWAERKPRRATAPYGFSFNASNSRRV